jgi:hypothetical protein
MDVKVHNLTLKTVKPRLMNINIEQMPEDLAGSQQQSDNN